MQKGDSQYIRGLNDQFILDIIFRQGRISRAEVSRIAELSKPTVSTSVQRLMDKALIKEVGRGENAQGRKATMLEFNYSAYFICGIELNDRLARIAFSRPDGSLLDYEELELNQMQPELFLQVLREKVEWMVSRHGADWSKVPYVSVALPAVIVPESGEASLIVTDLAAYEHAFSRESLERTFPAHVLIENDVNLATMAEKSSGAAARNSHFVYLSIGSGVGAGLVMNGYLVRGLGGAAGEIGHMRLGREGRVEELLSSEGLLKLAAKQLMDNEQPSMLRGHTTLTTVRLFDAARFGDEAALSIIASYCEQLAMAIHNLTTILAPELIVLGGEIGQHADVLIPVLEKLVDPLFPIRPVLTGSALGETAVALGAVNIAVTKAYEQIRNEIGQL
ncbi:ROK family transcriptional regulator [Paenibacillus sinopodophylli]|uniref:ROK family transcriptional regulator n=1 Tax=Paenibacillus sinopodophylli TaxID=1837342 RepID=UPI00110C9314|nr:ROK family transcriptional regulator [Paenibacillus sinopodophylli]